MRLGAEHRPPHTARTMTRAVHCHGGCTFAIHSAHAPSALRLCHAHTHGTPTRTEKYPFQLARVTHGTQPLGLVGKCLWPAQAPPLPARLLHFVFPPPTRVRRDWCRIAGCLVASHRAGKDSLSTMLRGRPTHACCRFWQLPLLRTRSTRACVAQSIIACV